MRKNYSDLMPLVPFEDLGLDKLDNDS
ncbi:hypothetical protein EYZ11_002566 [Aspergillus tanneri]|uniref:Uncharacterized protein n=1 Tax=Aspergillus tanneri TaxID=1220188 RepID=A0A4S3JQD9_9EURO|nr:hypothetical protein EYZ11_002566 [Aspergillus tanneri]